MTATRMNPGCRLVHRFPLATISAAMADERELSLKEQLEGIGAQLDWVRGYL